MFYHITFLRDIVKQDIFFALSGKRKTGTARAMPVFDS